MLHRRPYLAAGLLLLAGACKGHLIDDQNPGQNNPPGTTTPALAVRLGGTGFDQVVDIAADPDGSVYVTGTFSGSVDFDPGTGLTVLTSIGLADIFLAKYTAAGALVWADRLGGTAADTVTSLARDASGNLYHRRRIRGRGRLRSGPRDPGPDQSGRCGRLRRQVHQHRRADLGPAVRRHRIRSGGRCRGRSGRERLRRRRLPGPGRSAAGAGRPDREQRQRARRIPAVAGRLGRGALGLSHRRRGERPGHGRGRDQQWLRGRGRRIQRPRGLPIRIGDAAAHLHRRHRWVRRRILRRGHADLAPGDHRHLRRRRAVRRTRRQRLGWRTRLRKLCRHRHLRRRPGHDHAHQPWPQRLVCRGLRPGREPPVGLPGRRRRTRYRAAHRRGRRRQRPGDRRLQGRRGFRSRRRPPRPHQPGHRRKRRLRRPLHSGRDAALGQVLR